MIYLERNSFVFLQEHAQLTDTDPQVSSCELVWYVKSQRSKFPSLQCHTVEKTQREEKVLELFLNNAK